MNANKHINRIPVLGGLPFYEAIVDLCTGILMIFLFGPLFYGLKYTITEGSTEEILVMIFPNFLRLFKDLSLATVAPWLILSIAFILGIISRAIFVGYNLLPIKCLEKIIIARISFWLVGRWHKLGNWNLQCITKELIEKTPFEIGKRDYAEFRVNLEDPESRIKHIKPYWEHEEFLYLRSQHFYGMFLSFFLIYLAYGIFISIFKGLNFLEFEIWLGILLLVFVITILFFQEVIIHGVAFIEVNRLAYEQFLSNKTCN